MVVENENFTSNSSNRMYREQIVTREGLHEFRVELLNSIKAIITHQGGYREKQWLKSIEVRKLLNISPGTLQNLRINRELSYTKVGGILYYSIKDIENLLESNKVSASE